MLNGHIFDNAVNRPKADDVDMRDAPVIDAHASVTQEVLSRLCGELVDSIANVLEASKKPMRPIADASLPIVQTQKTKSASVAPAQASHSAPETARDQQLPSPPPSYTSVVSESIRPNQRGVPTSGPAFKRPSVPASATSTDAVSQGVTSDPRYTRADTAESRTSSVTVPTTPGNQRSASNAPQALNPSPRLKLSQNRKRKVELNLSSDEDDDEVSDYAPSEPDSPSAEKSARQAKNIPAGKKIKAATGIGTAQRVQKVSGKNGYGFKYALASKPKPAATPTPSPSTLNKKSTPPTPGSLSKAPATLTSATTAKTKAKPEPNNLSKMNFVPQPSKRRAALEAENKIQDMYEDEEEFVTESAIEAADEIEDARLPDDMRRMSITPAPRSVASQDSFTKFEDEEMLIDTAEKDYNYITWTEDRVGGDRHVSKQPGSRYQATVEDDDDYAELARSKCAFLRDVGARGSDVLESG
jgi:hypothetical protein